MKLELLIQTAHEPNPDKPPLLFVHGAWHGAWCWAEQFMPYFTAAGYNTYALSLRGHGQSEGRNRLRWTRVRDYVADVAQIVSTLPRLPVVIGHSMGGFVLQKYLEKYTAQAAVFLASAPSKGVLRTTLRIARHHPREFVRTNLTMSLYPLVGTPALTHETFFSADMPAQQVATYFSKMQDESFLAFLDMLMLDLPRPGRVHPIPMLMLGAEDDTVFNVSEIQATARAYQTEAIPFPHMAHDMMLDTGWEDVAGYIATWLDGLGS